VILQTYFSPFKSQQPHTNAWDPRVTPFLLLPHNLSFPLYFFILPLLSTPIPLPQRHRPLPHQWPRPFPPRQRRQTRAHLPPPPRAASSSPGRSARASMATSQEGRHFLALSSTSHGTSSSTARGAAVRGLDLSSPRGVDPDGLFVWRGV
jgi:hypothetical protein